MPAFRRGSRDEKKIGNWWPFTRRVFRGEEKTPRKKRSCKRGLKLDEIDIEVTKWGHYRDFGFGLVPELHSQLYLQMAAPTTIFTISTWKLTVWIALMLIFLNSLDDEQLSAEDYFQRTCITMLVMVDATHKRLKGRFVLCIEVVLKRRTSSV